MHQSTKLFFGFLAPIIFIVSLEKCDAIRCWECRSDIDSKCADPFDNSTFPITDCNFVSLNGNPGLGSTMCRTIKQKVNGVWSFYRSCAFYTNSDSVEKNSCTNRNSSNGIEVEYCTCDTSDGCNSYIQKQL